MTSHHLKSDFLQVMTERGFLHQCTDAAALDVQLTSGPVVAYCGYDCTAPSLHAGSLVSIMMLRWLQKVGHKPVVLMGGGTTRVGDPSGKDESRKMLTDADIQKNMAGIEATFSRFVTFGAGQSHAVMVNNAEWLDRLEYIAFLRDFGRHFSVNRMLTFDSVKLRLEREQPLTFLEFNYMILQAYDFLELSRRFGCVLQLGGSDQWGNILNGVELARRVDHRELFGLTCPLLTTSSGQKMGKTADGAVWLNKDMRSAWDYWQYWRNTEDADVGRFLRLFTELSLEEIERLSKLGGQEINEAKKVLATEVTALCHGRQAADEAAETARRTFEQHGSSAGLPTVEVSRSILEGGVALFELLKLAGLVSSNTEGRKLIQQGGARLNDAPPESEKQLVSLTSLNADGLIKLSAGKKRHVLVKPT
jgi:tyrosyl-tRNA synthetase